MTRPVSHNGYQVGWDGDFFFGRSPSDPLQDAVPAQVVGAAFLSGSLGVPVFYMDERGVLESWGVAGFAAAQRDFRPEDIRAGDKAVLCGPGVRHTDLVSAFCRRMPSVRLVVCPLLDHLPAFGHVAGSLLMENKDRPRSDLFYTPYDAALPTEYKEFDPALEGDGLGRMAHLVQSYNPVVNQMMQTPCISPFYNRVLSSKRWWSNPLFIFRSEAVSKFFPSEPLSLKQFASSWVPVTVTNTNMFTDASGWEAERVQIFVASDRVPGLSTFMRFFTLMCGLEFVTSTCLNDFPLPQKVAVFRYSRGYSVERSLYQKAMLDEC